jgi:TetR/AcrR family transcriptional regulator, regulator of cefoperazone and chloramphenicol sensitivity
LLELQVKNEAKTKRRRLRPGRHNLVVLRNEAGRRNQGRPKRIRDRTAKKDALILAALGLFASKGYEVTTTREIAAAAGCAEGLIHRYFKGKAGLLTALIECRISPPGAVDDRLQTASRLEDEFLELVIREVESIWENRDFFRIFIPRAIVDPSVGTTINKLLVSARLKEISARLKHCDSRSSLHEDSIKSLAQMVGMLGFAFGFVRPVVLRQNHLRSKRMAAAVARMFIDHLVNSPAA